MRVFSRDQEDGSMVMFLSRSVKRWQYVFGRISGIWILSTAFMFLLHLTIFLIILSHTGGMVSGYLTASLVCSVNLLFAIVLTCLLSLFLPNFIAAIFTLSIIGISYLSDGAYQAMQHELVKSFISGDTSISLWRIIYPKVYLFQYYASTLISNSSVEGMGFMYTWFNVAVYTVVFAAAMLWSFHRKEV
jgi:ABC-type transport system involved in multi-copper enzyme maturation permease subunit